MTWGGDDNPMNYAKYRKKVSQALKGRTGQIPWNKGKIGVYSDEILKRMSESWTIWYKHKGKYKGWILKEV